MIKYVYLTKTGTGIQSWFQENYKTLLIPMDSRKILYLMLTEVEWQIFMYCDTVKCKKHCYLCCKWVSCKIQLLDENNKHLLSHYKIDSTSNFYFHGYKKHKLKLITARIGNF